MSQLMVQWYSPIQHQASQALHTTPIIGQSNLISCQQPHLYRMARSQSLSQLTEHSLLRNPFTRITICHCCGWALCAVSPSHWHTCPEDFAHKQFLPSKAFHKNHPSQAVHHCVSPRRISPQRFAPFMTDLQDACPRPLGNNATMTQT